MNNWVSVDANFPTFEENESPYEQIKKLVDYMRQLTDQLKYSLNNLGTDNWNSSSLKSFSTELTGDIEKDMKSLGAEITRQQQQVRGVSTSVTALGEQIAKINQKLDEMITEEQQKEQKTAEVIEQLRQAIVKRDDAVERLMQAVSNLFAWINTDADGIAIGRTGAQVNINGDVYINGTQEG
jgi:predicted RNase H-like nuclease (RuvC/YqgF family)